jgi:phosphoenolpyruvate carboxylase
MATKKKSRSKVTKTGSKKSVRSQKRTGAASSRGLDPGLPEELRHLIGETVAVLGNVVREEAGDSVFKVTESTRKKMTRLRGATYDREVKALRSLYSRFEELNQADRCSVARSFSLMMEITNLCENAYRSYRLKYRHDHPKIDHKMKRAVFVLTAHPTEARPTLMIKYLNELQEQLIQCLERKRSPDTRELRHLIRLLWRMPLAKHERPTPQDEADHIFSLLFEGEIFEKILTFENKEGLKVFFRTWVGGDKDGHPGIDATVMRDCLQASRSRLITSVVLELNRLEIDLEVYLDEAPAEADRVTDLIGTIEDLQIRADGLSQIESDDGSKVVEFWKKLGELGEDYIEWIGELHPSLVRTQALAKIFPGLVMPIELRESAEAVADPEGEGRAIKGMLEELARIAGPAPIVSYARALVLSMAETKEDILGGVKLSEACLGNGHLPIIPLFEKRSALEGSARVMKDLLGDSSFRDRVSKYWNDQIEIMLGYSDSSKESGSLPSRLLIQESVAALDRVIRSKGVRPIFFHGSGGSVARGGGSIEDQTSWWPKSAREVFKVTIQGEMIQRSFATPEIMESQLRKIAQASLDKAASPRKGDTREILRKFATLIRENYQSTLESPDFLEVVEEATAYRYLNELKLGSRPSKRKASGDLKIGDLRAIPWVLSWTQTRVLFPTWWAVGSSFNELSAGERAKLKRAYREDPMFRSYVHLLGFTLSKVELAPWKLYLEKSGLSKETVAEVEGAFQDELRATIGFYSAMTGKESLLFFRPWLEESIYLRTKMIHPLNVLQLLALENDDSTLLRMTVSGIASGMLTTG